MKQKFYSQMSYAEYLQTDHWRRVRKMALEFWGNRCALCNSLKHLNVHHRTYPERGEETLLHVIVLCQDCHDKHHATYEPETDFHPAKIYRCQCCNMIVDDHNMAGYEHDRMSNRGIVTCEQCIK